MKHQEPNMREIRRKVEMYFDHALSKEDESALLQRVQNDPMYHRVFTSEQSMREQIRNKIHRPGVTPDLIQTIKNNIRLD